MKSVIVLSLLWSLALGAAAQEPGAAAAQEPGAAAAAPAALPPPVAVPPVNEKLVKFTAVFEKHDAYTQVEIKTLKADLEAYKNKKIYVEGGFVSFRDELPAYLERSGFASSKYYQFLLRRLAVPLLWKKTDDSKLLFTELPAGATLRVYGELKKLRNPQKGHWASAYGFEVAHVKLLKTTPEREPGKDREAPPRHPPAAVDGGGARE